MENISILGKQGWKIYRFQENRDGKYFYSRKTGMENISILGKQGWKIYLFQEKSDKFIDMYYNHDTWFTRKYVYHDSKGIWFHSPHILIFAKSSTRLVSQQFFLRTFPNKEYEIEGRYNMLCRRVLHFYKNIQNRLLYMR